MKRNFIYLLGALFFFTSCLDDNFKWEPSVIDGEVSFRASVRNSAATKTSYGDIANDKQEVFWVHGDEITVFGAECAVQQANYAVSVANPTTGEINKEQNYASKLDKTTPAGVQWGNVVQTDYYAVYPSTGSEFKAVGVSVEPSGTGDGGVRVSTKSATVTANISNIQKVDFNLYDTGSVNEHGKTIYGWKGVHYDSNVHNPSSSGALMYSCTSGAVSTDENGNPKPVDLQFRPFSTVLRFSFEGFEVSASGNENIDYNAEVFVNEIVLDAPTNIAGDFSLTINNSTTTPTAVAGEGTSDVIIIQPSVSIPLKTHERLEFDVFTIPREYTMGSDTDESKLMWTITLKTSGGDRVYKMIPKKLVNNEYIPTTATLAAGQIHNLTIPTLEIERPPVQIPDDSWMEYVPRNVYLSELSIPGAWYSTTAQYQGNVSLSDLYGIGVRAFNIDCRVSYDSVEKPNLSSTHTFSKTMSLVCAGTEQSSSGLGLITKLTYKQGVSVKSKLEELIPLVAAKEYIIIVLTVAEKPKMHNYGTGDYEFGTVDPEVVLEYINTMINDLRSSYKNKDGESIIYDDVITSNTTVNDVLGHMIVKVNVNTTYDNFNTYTNVPSTLISEASMASQYNNDVIVSSADAGYADLFKVRQDRTMYWGNTDEELDLTYKFHQAQLTIDNTTSSSTSSTPTLYDREKTVSNIIQDSDSLYRNELHNSIYQIGLGGYVEKSSSFEKYNSQAVVAEYLNTKLLNAINAKLINDPSPIGIVLMNFAYYDEINPSDNGGSSHDDENYTTNGRALTKAILEMNKKFFLNRDQNQEEWPDGDPFNPESDLPDESAAYVIIGGNAF